MEKITVKIKAKKRPANPEIAKRNAELYAEYRRLRMIYRADKIINELAKKTGLSFDSIQSIISREKNKQKTSK